MAVLFGTNVGETIFGTPDADIINGWDFSNLAGNEGPVDDNDTIVAGDNSDTLNGGAGRDILFGQSGADILNGGAGSDDLVGGIDIDTLNGGAGADNIFVEAGDGFDAIDGGADVDYLLLDRTGSTLGLTFSIAAPSVKQTLQDSTTIINIDWMIFRGGSGNDNVTGGDLGDQFFGRNGADTFNGGKGQDYLVGDAGNDILNGGDDYDVLIGGADQDQLDGGAGDDYVTGGTETDTVNGGSGIDQVYGGLGNDTVNGGADNDFIFVDALEGNDQIDGGIGADYLYFNRSGSSLGLTFSLQNTSLQQVLGDGTTIINVERMFFTGGSGADTVTGGVLDDVFAAGGGADRMTGLSGNDFYYVDNIADVVIDGINSGTQDRVLTSVNYALGADQQIELFSTTNSGGTGAINLTGSNSANAILGNNGANVINGGGGSDRMSGLNGIDQYFVDNVGDAVIESANNGTADRVYTSVSYTLGFDQQIELFTTTNTGLTGALNMTGNNVANRIVGNNGANTINGGLANDSLTGALGADKFFFNTAIAGGTNVDTISDFVHGTDDFQLSQAIFTNIGITLDANELKLGSAATTANDRIIYDGSTGNIFFDADGLGGAAQTQFAIVTAGTILDVGDFIMV